MIKLLWDFYGPDAEQTAQHHAIHLEQYAEKHKIDPSKAGVDPLEGGAAAWIMVEEEFMIKVRDDLRPKRAFRV